MAQPFATTERGAEAVSRLQVALERAQHPMLIADDRRRFVTGNQAAADFLGLAAAEIPWRTLDEYTAADQQHTLEERWQAFLSTGTAEGWYHFRAAEGPGGVIEFSATANVLPTRHLCVFFTPDGSLRPAPPPHSPRACWRAIKTDGSPRLGLTDREREILTLVAAGLRGREIAERLFLSPETIKSHVHNAMEKLNSHTRAHAVAVALVSGQIAWDV